MKKTFSSKSFRDYSKAVLASCLLKDLSKLLIEFYLSLIDILLISLKVKLEENSVNHLSL